MGNANNGGRRVLNEDQLFVAIREMLQQNNRSEKLIIYDHRQYPTLKDQIGLFHSARAIIGPHGGALYNILFAPAKVLIVEFFPDTRFDQFVALASFWIPARSVDGKFYLIPNPSGRGNDMNVDIPAIVELLRKELVPIQPQ